MADTLFSSEFYEGAAFHAHQAAEKVLKAALVAREAWTRTHSATEMLVLLRGHGMEIEEDLFRDARRVDRAYIDARYPRTEESGSGAGPADLYDRDTAAEVMQSCDRLMSWARSAPSSSDSSPS